MPPWWGSMGCMFAYLQSECVFWGRTREIRAAKIIFHVSGWQARHRIVAFARRRWFCSDRRRDSVSLGLVRQFSRQIGSWFGFDNRRHSLGDRVSHPVCRAFGGAMFSGDCLFVASPAFVGIARRQAGFFWHNYYGCGDCLTRTLRLFLRWPVVWPPGNCHSSLITHTGILPAL